MLLCKEAAVLTAYMAYTADASQFLTTISGCLQVQATFVGLVVDGI